MGTTDRSVKKPAKGIIKEAAKKGKDASKEISNFGMILSFLGMNRFIPGKGSKKYENLKTSSKKHKSTKKRQENKARATQARKNKKW